jgi:hypothetical protein
MRAEFELEEARELMVFIIERLVQEGGLPEADRVRLREWRAEMTPGSDGMRDLAARINADLARALQNQKRSAVMKPDWR